MKKVFFKVLVILLVLGFNLSCTKSRVKSECRSFINNANKLNDVTIIYPKNNTIFPADFQAPAFRWSDNTVNNSDWYICIIDSAKKILLDKFIKKPEWRPDSIDWEHLKENHISEKLQFTVIGFNKNNKDLSGSVVYFQISPDSVGADIFFRAVTLPFSYAVRNVNTIEWYMGSVRGGAPRKMLDNMPVCANCHSFTGNGPTLAMDVDYGNDKGSYILAHAKDTCLLKPEDIISWSNFKKDEGDPTFGLLSQISPSGKYVLSTVKDLSVFAAVDDNLAYSQLFFPIKGIIGIYDTELKKFSELKGANNPKYVQSNPVWSPDNKKVLFARTDAYVNEKVKKYGNALLNINDVREFKSGNKEFKFNIYSVDFNNGEGGVSKPLQDASDNGKSNYFPKYSPDGKWIVFCKSDNFMLLQPDSKLYIMQADGTNARLMNCNMDNMNSWHSWSPNGHWLVFSSKQESLYTRLYLTHIDENGMDSPPVLLENLVFNERAANIPEFFPGNGAEFASIKDDFSNTAAYFTRLAMDNIKSHYYIKADKNLKRALALDPKYIDTYISRILLNSILQQVNSKTEKEEKTKALEIVDDLLLQKKNDLELLFLKANLMFASGDNLQAEKILISIISSSPGFYRAYDLLASLYKKNKTEKVIQVYDKMRSLVPANDLDINLLKVKYYLSVNQADEALSILKGLAKKYPDYQEIHENLCRIYINKKEVNSAQKEINFLLESDSTNYSYYFMHAEIAEIAGNSVLAKNLELVGSKMLQVELDKNKENIPLFFEKASHLQKNKDLRGAESIYNDVLKILPFNYQALKEKARIMLMMQQWQEAIKLYQELSGIYNPEEEFFNNSAIAYINMGNYPEALNQFNQTLKLNPSNIDALFNRAKLYRILGNTEKATADINKMKQILRNKENLTESEKQLLKK